MDPRMLLNPKAMLKNKKAAKTKDSKFSLSSKSRSEEDPSAKPGPPSSSSGATVKKKEKSAAPQSTPSTSPPSPTQVRPSFDPRALLDPRSQRRTPRSSATMATNNLQEPSSEDPPTANGTGNPHLLRHESSDGKRILEKVYSVESRTDQPRKKIKTVAKTEDSDTPSRKQNCNSSGTGIVSDYMNPAKGPDAEDKPTLIPQSIVDLTNDDDDDDLEITGSANVAEKEVFFGAVYMDVDAYLTPKPSTKHFDHTQNMWPAIRCSLQRKPEHAKTLIITVSDAHNVPFANVEQRVAKVLVPAMDVFPKLRTRANLLARKHSGNEWTHQPTSMTMKLMALIYGRRCDAEKIGRLFGQGNVWFIDSSLKEPGIETVNPHKLTGAKRNAQQQQIRSSVKANNVGGGEATEEEAAQNVLRIFDHHATEKLPESEPPSTVLTPLLSHQKQGLTFMLRHESPRTYGDEASGNSTLWSKKYKKSGKVYYEEAVSNLTIENEQPPESFGGLLADVMGLGKTLESLTLVAATSNAAEAFGKSQVVRVKDTNSHIVSNTKGTLIVCPMSTVANWENQIKEHLDDKAFTWYTHHGSNRIKNAFELRKFNIVITTYGTLQSEARRGDGVLRNLQWFRVILDEAHTIREPSAQQSQACYDLNAERRWCLTGTPIQNKLADLGSLCQFLRLFPYDTVQNFQYYIGKRAAQGDSNFLVRLRVFIDSFTLRRQRDQINLPDKQDLVEAIEFSESERKLHDFFRDRAQIAVDTITKREGKKQNLQISVLQGITTLRLISAHGRDLLRDEHLDEYRGADKNEPINLDEDDGPKTISKLEAYEVFKMMADADFDFCRNCETAITGNSPLTEFDSDDALTRCFILPCRDLICADCFKQYQPIYDMQDSNHPIVCPLCRGVTSSTYIPIEGSVNDTIEKLQASGEETPVVDRYSGPHTKTLALLRDINEMTQESKPLEAKGEPPLKCVVFSEFTSHLTLIARALHAQGYRTERIDGTMSLPKRKKVLEALATDNTLTILLASIKAAGQGLNLTSASRAFIMEPLWNPAAEAQAVDRIYRIGQTRPVLVKRYHMKDSIEEVIMKLAQKKQKLADLSLNRNHKALSKKEQREQHYEDIKALFAGKKR